jgi:hypothetical protein
MIRSIRAAALVGAGVLVLASIANADPDPAHSTVPAFIFVGGSLSDPAIVFTITVHDNLDAPIYGSNVEIDFINCTDTRLCAAVTGVDCAGGHKRVLATTNSSGQVTLSIGGGGTNVAASPQNGGTPGAGAGCIRVLADGIELGTATSVVYDQNGGSHFTGADLVYVYQDIITVGLRRRSYLGRTDYNGDGRISPIDLVYETANLGREEGPSGGGTSCGPYCP